MNWKLQIGIWARRTEQATIKLNSGFIRKNFPYGQDWMFDVKRIIKDTTVIIDGGANIGSVSLELNHWFPNANVFAFEPVKNNI